MTGVRTPQSSEVLKRADVALLIEGDLRAARNLYETAAQFGLEHDDPETLARAALGLGGLWVHEHRTAVEAARIATWQQRALTRLDPESPTAARLRIRLTAEREYRRGTSDGIAALLEAARLIDQPVVLADALNLTHHCLLGPGHAHQRLEIAEELLAVAGLTGRVVDEALGLLWRTVDLFLDGDPHTGRSLHELSDLTTKHHLGAIEFVVEAIRVMLLVRADDLDAAEKAATACLQRGQKVGDADALGWYAAQLVNIRWFQGRLPEVVPVLAGVVDSPTLAGPNEALLAAQAVAHAKVGDPVAASMELRRLRGAGLASLPNSSTWLVTLAAVIEAAVELGDTDLAEEAAALLAPYANRPIMASLAVVCFGSVHYALGRAALAVGAEATAEHHLGEAVRANEQLGHRPALRMAETWLREVVQLRETEARSPITVQRSAEGWHVCFNDRHAYLPDSVGVQYLAALINRPGQDITALELSGAGLRSATPAEPLIDAEARRAYARRAQQLQTDLDAAVERGDQRVEMEVRSELDWLLDEVQHATGLRGRPRSFADEAERARTSVQKAIRRTLAHIGQQDAKVAEILRSRITTGSRCSYRPDSFSSG